MSSLPVHSGRGKLRRSGAFLAISLAVHALALLLLAATGEAFWLPRLNVTWLDLDNRLGAPQPAPPRPAPQPKRAITPAPRPPPRPVPRPKRQGDELASVVRARDAGVPPPDRGAVAPDAGAAGSGAARIALSDLAPGDAALILLLRMDRIRQSPYQLSVRRLLEVFYDHKTILWGSGLDPINDFEALLIATPNPYRVTETFLAGRTSRSPAELRAGLERATSFGGKRLRWIKKAQGERGEIPSPPKLASDPRVIWLQSDLVLLTDPKQIDALTAPGPAGDAGVAAPGWLGRLGLMGDRAATSSAGLLLQAVNLPRLVALPQDLPAPLTAQVSIEAVDPARTEAVLSFASEANARSFLEEARRRIEQVRQSSDRVSRLLRWFGVADLLASIRFERKQAVINASLKLTGKEVQALLELARGFIPQVQVPGMPDRRPIDAGAPRVDAGPPRIDATSGGQPAVE